MYNIFVIFNALLIRKLFWTDITGLPKVFHNVWMLEPGMLVTGIMLPEHVRAVLALDCGQNLKE